MKAHVASLTEIYEELKTSKEGLKTEDAQKRLEKYGYNELKEQKVSALCLFFAQFKSMLIIILLAAVIISAIMGEILDAIVIGAVLLLNTLFGFAWEYKAEMAIEALKKMSAIRVTVIRDGEKKLINAKELVPGDIMILDEGDKISADGRIIESFSFQTQESALTGESLPVEKNAGKAGENASISDRHNMVFSGTIATNGRAIVIVTASGMSTELGKVATLIQEAEKEIPLKKHLDKLGKVLGIIVIAISIIIFGAKALSGGNMLEMFILAVALAVAAVPEGLPAVVTIALSLGVQRMAKNNALIRKLPSVETLGSTTVICTDKTGTLTMNEMTVRKLFANNITVDVSGQGYNPSGKFTTEPKEVELLLRVGALCNNASISPTGENLIGDPTEGALLVSAMKAGIDYVKMQSEWKRIDETAFSSERKMMTTIHEAGRKKYSLVKGALNSVLDKCTKIYIHGKIRKLTKQEKDAIIAANNDYAKEALRVLAFAMRPIIRKEDAEKELVFVGLQGMIDPPRAESKTAIEKCKKAGIKVIMITGDQKLTAEAIGRELGIRGESVTGEELEKISDSELAKRIEKIAIYARVNPAHKLRIITALKKKGHVVAMTGDGVNDAPALKEANIGIAMGINGTDVAKEASDMILLDDNFSTIVNAVEEGRGIYDNIRKFVMFLLSSNIAEVMIVLLSVMLGMPLPLVAIQILWINMITDTFPALALGVDPIGKNLMQNLPRNPREMIINRKMAWSIVIFSAIITAATIFAFRHYSGNLQTAQTVAFTTIVLLELSMPFVISILFRARPFANPWLISAVVLSVVLQLGILYTPLNSVFKSVALGSEWILISIITAIAIALSVTVAFFLRYSKKERFAAA